MEEQCKCCMISGLLKSDEPEKVPPSEKELKVIQEGVKIEILIGSFFQEEEKRKVAQKEAEDERKKKHIKEEYQREKANFRNQNNYLENIL